MAEMLLPSLVDGLLLGFVFGIAAMGLSLIWGVMNVINLSHGPIIALGMFGVYFRATPPTSYTEVMECDKAAFNHFFHAMLIYIHMFTK